MCSIELNLSQSYKLPGYTRLPSLLWHSVTPVLPIVNLLSEAQSSIWSNDCQLMSHIHSVSITILHSNHSPSRPLPLKLRVQCRELESGTLPSRSSACVSPGGKVLPLACAYNIILLDTGNIDAASVYQQLLQLHTMSYMTAPNMMAEITNLNLWPVLMQKVINKKSHHSGETGVMHLSKWWLQRSQSGMLFLHL